MIALLASALLTASPGPMPGTEDLMEKLAPGLPNARVGEYVTYRLKGGQLGEAYWRLAVVGEEKDVKGRPAIWVELDSGTHVKLAAPMMQMRFLVTRAGAFDADSVTRAYLALGHAKPQEVLPADVPKLFESDEDEANEPPVTLPESERNAARVRKGEPRRLMTLAGTVKATPTETFYRNTVLQRFWTSEEIPLLQLAKIEKPGVGYTMEVADFGLTAKPQMRLPGPNEPKLRMEPQAEGSPGLDTENEPEEASDPAGAKQ